MPTEQQLSNLFTADLHRLRQWFNAVKDTNPKYIEPEDRELYRCILAVLKSRSEWK